MPKLVYALMCTDLIIDKDSNSTSFIRSIEHAVVPELPAALPPVYFASLWDMEDAQGEPFSVSLTLAPPAGEAVTLGTQEITPGQTMLHKMNFQIPGITVNAEGRHDMTVSIQDGDSWIELVRLPLFVFKAAT